MTEPSGNIKKDNNCVCFKCKIKMRHKNQSYCYECFYEKFSAYQKNKFTKKRAANSNIVVENLDGEIWVAVSFNERYSVSNLGRVKSLFRTDRWGNIHKREDLLKDTFNANGYKVVRLYTESGEKRNISIHRLVAMHFVENLLGEEVVNHKDGNKSNNTPSNLEWCTVSYNTKHAWENGLIKNIKQGSDHPQAKLNNAVASEIRALYASGVKQIELSKKYAVARQTISRVIKNLVWA